MVPTMQRRVAAIYFAFFLLMGASAYSVIAVAEEPAIDVAGQSYGQGDTFTVDEREYVVGNLSAGNASGGEGAPSGTLMWTNESAQFTATVANNTTVSPVRLSFSDQEAYYAATLAEGDTVQFNGSETTVSIPDVESPSNFSLVRDGNATATFASNDTFVYRGNATTVTEVTAEEVRLEWGDDYRVLTPNETDPSSFRMVQQFNVSQRLSADPAVENRTVTRDDGQRYVVFASNGTTRLLGEYLPAPDVGQIQEGDSLTFRNNETTVANVTATGIVLEWTGPQTNTIELSEGANVTLNGQQRVVHFQGDSVILSQEVVGYQEDLGRQDYFTERQNGLWGVTILSGLAAMFVIVFAYLPVRG